MGNKMLNSNYNYPLADGTTVPMTLTFYALYQLKSKNELLYKRYNKVLAAQANKSYDYDELDNMTVLYTAYCCANMNSEELMNEEEFLAACGSDRKVVGEAIKALLAPKN